MNTPHSIQQSPQQSPDTFPKCLLRNANKFAAHAAIREKEYGIWQTWVWAQYYDEVERFAAGLKELGFKRGDRLFIVGSNRPRLYWAVSAAQCLGGVPVPTYSDSVANEMLYVIEHAEVNLVIAEDQEQVDKILEIKDRCKSVETIIYDNERGLRDYPADSIKSFTRIQSLGETALQKTPDLIKKEIEQGKPEDASVILYTSGTTGNPKGVVLTYRNILTIAKNCSELEGLHENDSVVAYLPMAWVVDHFISYAQSHVAGFCVCCPESPDTLMKDSREIGPTYHFTSPRVLENHRTDIMIRMEDAGGLKRKMFHYFMGVADKVGIDVQEGRRIPFMDNLKYKLGKFFVFEPLKNSLGYSRTRLTYTAGEAIGPDMFNFFRSIGIHLKQVYGQTEASPFVTLQPNHQVRADTVGIAVTGVEVKLDENGEVLFNGPGVFHEYFKNPEATVAAKTEDGWVRTGDTGLFDKDGHLKIIDRSKDVGRLNNGSLFAPKYIENKLKFFPYILEAVSFGHERDEAMAMINIDLNAVGDWAERRGMAYASYQELAAHTDTYTLIRECIEKVNADLAGDELLCASQVTRFLILHKELDADDGELTRTRKVRRRSIIERYAPLIEALYGGKKECHIDTEVTFEDGRKGIISAELEIQDVKTFASQHAKAA